MTGNIPPRPNPKNTASSRVLGAMAQLHAKADAKADLGSETPATPARSAGVGRAVIPARFQSGAAPPVVPKQSAVKPTAKRRSHGPQGPHTP